MAAVHARRDQERRRDTVAIRETVKRHAPAALRILAVAAAYYAAARFGLLLAVVRGQVTPLWPPTGIAMFALLVWGLRTWPGITLGALLVNLPIGPSVPDVLVIAAGNTAAPVAAYLLLSRTGYAPGRCPPPNSGRPGRCGGPGTRWAYSSSRRCCWSPAPYGGRSSVRRTGGSRRWRCWAAPSPRPC